MSDLYRCVFYRFYCWSCAVNKGHELHEFNATVMLSFLMLINLATVPAIIELCTDYNVIEMLQLNRVYGVLAGAAILFSNYIVLRNVVGFSNAIAAFANEDERQRRRGSLFLLIYVMCSFVGFFGAYMAILKLSK